MAGLGWHSGEVNRASLGKAVGKGFLGSSLYLAWLQCSPSSVCRSGFHTGEESKEAHVSASPRIFRKPCSACIPGQQNKTVACLPTVPKAQGSIHRAKVKAAGLNTSMSSFRFGVATRFKNKNKCKANYNILPSTMNLK